MPTELRGLPRQVSATVQTMDQWVGALLLNPLTNASHVCVFFLLSVWLWPTTAL